MLHHTLLLSGRHAVLAALALLLVGEPSRAESISGVCPDGSIFIVQQADAVPCRGAKRVDPGDIPPLNPEFLPRPYGWEVFNRETDPYNPYNVIDTVRPSQGGAPPVGTAPPLRGAPQAPVAGDPTPPVAAPPAPRSVVAAAPPPSAAPMAAALGLAPAEVDDLVAIVGVLQQSAPATFVERTDSGAGLRVALARSAAFEARVGAALAARGAPPPGPVLAFHVEADGPGDFWGNLTFVQGHMAFHPDPGDATQFGIVDGSLGRLAPGDRVLGYAVLPSHADTSQPLDVYWDDRLLSATFTP